MAVDIVGYLPAPATKGNRGAADLLEGQLFAYGTASGVAVVEVGIRWQDPLISGSQQNVMLQKM